MLTKSYNNFWQRMHKSAKTKGLLLRVMFELTYRCNFKCGHCYVPFGYRKLNELKTREVFSILDQLKGMGCFYLGFTGGEPFLREDIFDISRYAKKIGFQIIFYTNGSLIDEAKAKELIRLNPNKVDITIPAMSKAAFERISKVGGSHDNVFHAIDLLYKKNVNLGFKTCVLKENEDEIEEIQRFAQSLGAQHRLDDLLSARLDGSKEPFKYRGKSKESLVTGYKSPATSKRESEDCNPDIKNKKSNHEPRTTNHEELFKCGVGHTQAAITPQGELKMCLMVDYPKYKILDNHFVHRPSSIVHRKEGLNHAWVKLKNFVAKIRPDENYQCDKCQVSAYCKWCPARSWLYNRSFTSCEPGSLRWAGLRKRNYENRG